MVTNDHRFCIHEFARLLSILEERGSLPAPLIAQKKQEWKYMLPMLDPNYDFEAARYAPWTPGNTRYKSSAKGNLNELICLNESVRMYGSENIIDYHDDEYINSKLKVDFGITKWRRPVLVQAKSSTRTKQYGVYVHVEWFEVAKNLEEIQKKFPGAFLRISITDYEDQLVGFKDAFELAELFVKYTKNNEDARIPTWEWKANKGILNNIAWYRPVDNT